MGKIKLNIAEIRDLAARGVPKVAPENLSGKLAACVAAAEKALGLTAFDEQLTAAAALYSGKIAEMKTGEGKTLAAVFAAYLYKCDGAAVHVFTFNDYLAKRDYNWMKPVYDLLGVNTALITEQTPFEERKAAYNGADVIYSTVKEAGFDFLRDFLVFDGEHRVHKPGVAFDTAIFDEADSVLIDEARIPLVIAGDIDAEVGGEFLRAFEFVKRLTDDDYDINPEIMSAFLTDEGVAKTEKFFGVDNLYDESNIELRCSIETCMKAMFYLKEDKDYVVKDGKIRLIDPLSGRIAWHRLFPGALQSAVELKHGLESGARGVVTGVIPIQFLARQYRQICGMTGTAEQSAEEFELLYGLQVEVIKPHKPSIRVDNPPLVYYDGDSKWNALISRVSAAHKKRQPVLIGTAGIEESENLARCLKSAGVKDVTVLNAKNDEMEAEVIKNAGVAGAVTVSTNMAGRGVDIKLGSADESGREEVVKAGGLLVIGTAMYENARMNEQLNGRAGRQGDPGETALFVALDDEIMQKYNLRKLLGWFRYPKPTKDVITSKAVLKEVQRVQRIAQGALLEDRKRLLRFTMIGEKHRDIIFRKRAEYLDGGSPEIWSKNCPAEYAKAVKKHGESVVAEAERLIALSAINEVWCDYLEYTSELRTGIHLRAVAGRNPSEEYNIDSERYFEGVQERLVEKVSAALPDIVAAQSIAQDSLKLFKPRNTRTFLMEESGDELVRKPILLNIFGDSDDEDGRGSTPAPRRGSAPNPGRGSAPAPRLGDF